MKPRDPRFAALDRLCAELEELLDVIGEHYDTRHPERIDADAIDLAHRALVRRAKTDEAFDPFRKAVLAHLYRGEELDYPRRILQEVKQQKRRALFRQTGQGRPERPHVEDWRRMVAAKMAGRPELSKTRAIQFVADAWLDEWGQPRHWTTIRDALRKLK